MSNNIPDRISDFDGFALADDPVYAERVREQLDAENRELAARLEGAQEADARMRVHAEDADG